MRAVTWQGRGEVAVTDVPDPRLEAPTDIIVKVTSTAICGWDLHLIGPMTPFMTPGDVLGHEFMGIVEEVGTGASRLRPGTRVVVPFNIACGRCYLCAQGLQSQCETTQQTSTGTGAALFGYTKLYGQVPGGQAEYVRVPQAHYGPIELPEAGSDEHWLYLSDILPTAWQAVAYADPQPGDTVAVVGLGPVGQLVARCAFEQGATRVIGIDLVPERLAKAAAAGVEVIDAAGVDRLAALETAFEIVRRGGTVSLAGVYGGAADPLNLMMLFDKQVTIRMGQANVRRWTDRLLELLAEGDTFGVETLASHHLPLEEAVVGYQKFRDRTDGCIKVVLHP